MDGDFKDDKRLIASNSKSVTFDKHADEISTGIDEDDEENATTLSVNTKLEMAATLINEARYGRHGIFKLTPKEVRLYNSYYTFKINYLIHALVCLNLALAIFEKPAVYDLPYWATMIMEYVCIFVFAIFLFHKWYIAPDGCFWGDRKNKLIMATIIITFLDMLLYSIFMENGLEAKALRWSRILRPIFVINLEGRQIRRSFRNIRRTIVGVANVLILLLLAIGLFALLATKLFENRNLKDIDGNPYFIKYFESYYQLYIFTTTANSPDVGIPAYDSNNWFALFFIVFVVICMYIFLSILLAVVYANYRKHLKNEVRKSVYRKRRQLRLAFDLICEKLKKTEKTVLKFERWKLLLEKLCPRYSPGKVSLLWHVLDRENRDYIEVKDFLRVSELLNIRVVEVKDEVHLFEKICPAIYLSWLSVKIRKMVCHRYFLYFFDVVIFVNAIVIALSFEMAEGGFLLLFNTELLLKLYTYGCREFFANFWNTFDFVVIEGATVSFIVEITSDSVTASQAAVDFLMILRVLRMIKLIGTIERFKVVVNTVMQIGPSIAMYGGIVFIWFYVYAILGMEIFQGKIRMLGYPNATANASELFCGDVKLKNSEFYNEHYCGDNFNDILKSLKILFDLMVVNQWHILTQGFVLVTSKAARLYFVSFHLTCVILVLNIFVAFIIEAFMLQYTFSHGKFESELEKVIQEKGVGIGMTPITERSRTGTTLSQDLEMGNNTLHRTRSQMTVQEYARNEERRYRLVENQIKTAENLLQQMFEDEIGSEDIGPQTLVEIEKLEPVEVDWNKVTFETIG
ncbi:two pore calcium channel protein 1-like [Dendronephthya gigantea]|uniref:two pore calcium channel protein 1-like n=1 Tax=Dendronephthya gigantea TaxID=151771 RepID=UPI00106CB1C6|nr:two pore calcium channel protein 1-like [Dendronephthya gigantea]